jgi:hypothetical protein
MALGGLAILRISQAGLICALLLGAGAVSAAGEYFGAIAYSSTTRAHGWSKDFPSRTAAEKAAVAGCAKHGEDCRAVLWFKNACGALALGPKAGVGWDWAEDQAVADRRAINACARQSKACTVKQRVCTTR